MGRARPIPRAGLAVARLPDKGHPLLVTVPGAALCAARLPATACTPPLTGRLSRRSHSHRPRRPVAPVLLLPCRNLGSPAQRRVHKPVNLNGADPSAAGSQGPITPSEQPASSTSQVRLIPLAAPPAVTHPLIFHAKYQNRRWFPTGSAANPWHAGWRPVSLHRQRRLLPRRPNEQRGIGKQSVLHLPSGDDVFRPEVAERQRDQDQRVGDRHRGALDHPGP